MTSNPYSSPGAPLPGDDFYGNRPGPDEREVRRVARRPAICLIVASAVCIAVMLAVLCFDAYLLGIPFGIWALVVLHDPVIRYTFR